MLLLIRLGSKALKTLIIDLSNLVDYSEDVFRYAFHELSQVEQLIIQGSNKDVPFKNVAYIMDKNKEQLAKLCMDLPLEESSVKHFTTLILNMNKLRHLHLTANTNIDKM